MAFNVVDSAHFRSVCQNRIQIGAKYGNVNAADVLVGRKTVRADRIKLAESVKSTIREKLRRPIEEGTVAMTTDFWSDNMLQRSYLDMSFV